MQRNVVVMLSVFASAMAAGCADTDLPLGASGRGQYGFETRDRARAASAAEVDLPKILPLTYFAAGQLLEHQGRAEAALQQYQKTVAVAHEFHAAHHRIGLLYSQAGRRTEALKWLEQAVQLSSKNAAYRNNLGYELMLHERWSEAEAEFAQAIELDPAFARARINQGMVLSKMGRFEDALESFQAVLPEPDARYNLGLMYRGQQRYQEAAEAFNQVLSLNPDFTAAAVQLEQLAPRLEKLAWNSTRPVEESDAVNNAFPGESRVAAREATASSVIVGGSSDSAGSETHRVIPESLIGPAVVERTDLPGFASLTTEWESLSEGMPSPMATPTLNLSATSTPPTASELNAALSIARNEIACLEEQMAWSGASWITDPTELSTQGQASSWMDGPLAPTWCSDESWGDGTAAGSTGSSPSRSSSQQRPTMGMTIVPSNSSNPGNSTGGAENSFVVPDYWPADSQPASSSSGPVMGPPAPDGQSNRGNSNDESEFGFRLQPSESGTGHMDESSPSDHPAWKGWNPDITAKTPMGRESTPSSRPSSERP